MIYSIAQTVAFASLAGAVFTSSVSPALPHLPKPQKNSFIKSLKEKASVEEKYSIHEEEDINSLTFSARTAAETVGEEDTPYYLQIGFYSDSACNIKESAEGHRMNYCIYDDDEDESHMFQVFGKNNNKILFSFWDGDTCSGRAERKYSLLDFWPDSSGKPARLGKCQLNSNDDDDSRSNEFVKFEVFDDYPSRKPSTNGQFGLLSTYFQEPAQCSRNDYSNFYQYYYGKFFSGCWKTEDLDMYYSVVCSRNRLKLLFFDEVDCNGVNYLNYTANREKCSLGDDDDDDVYSTYCV